MKKLNTSPISGMMELLPQPQAVFNKLKDDIREVYRAHGFLEIETPTIDRAEILFAKAGGDTEKQIYKVVKTEEAAEGADQALRFDHTVPLARYVTEYESNLNFPFKVTQMGRNFRGERAQKGRFREFYQCDIDVIGRNLLPLSYDADVIVTLAEAVSKILFGAPFLVRISNRKLFSGFIEERNLQEVAKEIFSIVDHAEKVPPEKTRAALDGLGISDERVAEILDLLNISGDLESVSEKLYAFPCDAELFKLGRNELCSVLALVGDLFYEFGIKAKVVADLKIVRGLDYYTGTVFETMLPDFPEVGSICSGGRYENLAELYTDQKFPGVGGSIGLTRLFAILSERFLIPEDTKVNPVDLVLIPFSKDEEYECFKIAAAHRLKTGAAVDIALNTEKSLGDRFKYAAKVARFAAVVGPDEVKTRTISVKNLTTGEQTQVSF